MGEVIVGGLAATGEKAIDTPELFSLQIERKTKARHQEKALARIEKEWSSSDFSNSKPQATFLGHSGWERGTAAASGDAAIA